jgi:cobalamin synthase
MRDHCIGSYGGTALVLLVVLKVSAYGALLQGNQWLPALVLVPALGRWSILLLTATLPYARQSSSVVRDMGRSSIVWGSLTVAIALDGFKLWVPMIAVIALSFLFGSYCRRRIGGITGDTLGANSQLCECAALVTLLWTFHA